VDGRTGQIGWRQTRGRTGRDFGRWWMSLYDFDGDALDDVLNVYPDMFCVARGRDGELLVAEESHKYVDIYAYYADALVADFLAKGEPQVLYSHEFVTALFSGRGQRIWKIEHAHPGGWRNQVGWGDADGDGRAELFFPGAAGPAGREFQCRDAATGDLRWRIDMPDQPLTFPAVADIDSDGCDECVLSIGNTIFAVGQVKATAPSVDPTGEIQWTLDLPANAGPAAFADVDGSGTGQLVVVAGDGYVYGIGPAKAR